jgi:Ca2+-binding RTX toxin-like protein
MDFTGTSGDDTLTGTSGDDLFKVYQGGNDTVSGFAGKDVFNFAGTLTAADTIDGGGGQDTVQIKGDYAAGLTFAAATMVNVETLTLGVGFNYTLTTDDATVAAGAVLTINASTLGGANWVTFNGSNETDGLLHVHGGAGDDTIGMGNRMIADDHFDGSDGFDELILSGTYNLTFKSITIHNIEEIALTPDFGGSLAFNSGNVLLGQTIEIDGSGLSGAGSYIINANNLPGNVVFDGGPETAKVTTGSGADTFDMGANFTRNDRLAGGSGNDTLNLDGNYNLTLASTTIAGIDQVNLTGGHSYHITSTTNLATDQTMTVNATALTASDSLFLDFSSETAGSVIIDGGAAPAILKGGQQGDAFDFSVTSQGGLTASDQIDGQGGYDRLYFDGDYTGGHALTMNATTVTNVEEFDFNAGHSYSVTTADATVATGAALKVDASVLGASDTLTFNGSAETDGQFAFVGGAGNDALTGGALADTFDLTKGGSDTAHGGGGADTFNLAATFTSADAIDGGAGNDVVQLSGDYSGGVTFGAATITNVETLSLHSGFSYNFTTNDANVGAGQTLAVNGGALGAGNVLTVNGAAETDGSFAFIGGAGNDTLTGGAQADSFDLSKGGEDTAEAGGGNDTFTMGSAFTAGDVLNGGTGNDTVVLNGPYSQALTASNFNSIETLSLTAGHTYSFTSVDANVGNGATLTVDGHTLGASDTTLFDGSADTDGTFHFLGGAGNDTDTSGALGAVFDFSTGGNDRGTGGSGGVSTFIMGAALDANDTLNGGTGGGILQLAGTYTGGTALASTTNLTHIKEIDLAAGGSYAITLSAATISGMPAFTLNGSALGAGDTISFDGTAATTLPMTLSGGAGNDTLKSGGGAASFDLTKGGDDTATGGAGADTFTMGAQLSAGDVLNGGGGSDTVVLSGTYSQTLTAGNFASIETLKVSAGANYTLTTVDANVASGATLTVDASALAAANSLTFNGAAETNGHFVFTGGAGNDTLTSGTLGASFDLTKGGSDTATGGAGGASTFTMGTTLDSTDRIDGGAGGGSVTLDGAYAGLSLSATVLKNIGTIDLTGGFAYNLTWASAAGPAASFTLDGTAASAITVDFSAITSGGGATILGSAGNDTIAGAQGGTVDISQGGHDTVNAEGGTILAGAAFDTADAFSNANLLTLNGTYSGFTISAGMVSGTAGELLLTGGHSYGLTIASAAQFSEIVENNAGGSLSLSGTAETTNPFHIDIVAGGNDTVSTGGGADVVSDEAGTITFNGHGGNDSLTMSVAFGASVFNAGGGSDDELHILDADTIVATATNIIGVDVITFAQNGSFTASSTTVPTGGFMLVQETGSGTLNANASADTDSTSGFSYDNENTTGGNTAVGGAGNDFLISFGNNNTLTGGAGADSYWLGAGSSGNTIIINAVADSTSTHFDSVLDFIYTTDHFKLSGIGPTGKPVAIDPFVNTGSLTTANFDANLAADISASKLAGHHAVLFTPSSGDYGASTFLIVDENGTPGYQAGADLVIEVNGSGFTGLTTSTFT